MTIEKTIQDLILSNKYGPNASQMNAEVQQSIFKIMGIKTFYIGKSLDDPQRPTVICQGSANVPYDIFISPETKSILEP